MSERPHHRPDAPGRRPSSTSATDGVDPALVTGGGRARRRRCSSAARATATTPAVAERLVHLADTEGIEAIAQVWSHAAGRLARRRACGGSTSCAPGSTPTPRAWPAQFEAGRSTGRVRAGRGRGRRPAGTRRAAPDDRRGAARDRLGRLRRRPLPRGRVRTGRRRRARRSRRRSRTPTYAACSRSPSSSRRPDTSSCHEDWADTRTISSRARRVAAAPGPKNKPLRAALRREALPARCARSP